MTCPVGTRCAPRNYTRDLSGHPEAVRKRRWRAQTDPDRLRAVNREHQRAKRGRDRKST